MAEQGVSRRLGGCFEVVASVFAMLLVGGLVRGCMQSDRPNVTRSSPQDKQALIAQVSSAVNKDLPKMVDSATRLDSTSAGPGDQFFYNYTLVSIASRDADGSGLHSFAKDLTQKVCGSSDMQRILSLGVTAVYLYRGNDGQEIGRIPINSSNCSSGSFASPIIASRTRAAPQTDSYSNRDLGASVGANYSTSHNKRCWASYQRAIESIPDSASIGEAGELASAAKRKLDSCVK